MFLANLVKGALQRELNEFFQAQRRSDVAECVITKSAFCAARKKLKPSAFVELSNHLLRHWYRMARVKRWNGLDLRSVDGTTHAYPVNTYTHYMLDVSSRQNIARHRSVSRPRPRFPAMI